MPRTLWMAAMCCQRQVSCHCPDRVTIGRELAAQMWQTCWLALTPVHSTTQVSPANCDPCFA